MPKDRERAHLNRKEFQLYEALLKLTKCSEALQAKLSKQQKKSKLSCSTCRTKRRHKVRVNTEMCARRGRRMYRMALRMSNGAMQQRFTAYRKCTSVCMCNCATFGMPQKQHAPTGLPATAKHCNWRSSCARIALEFGLCAAHTYIHNYNYTTSHIFFLLESLNTISLV